MNLLKPKQNSTDDDDDVDSKRDFGTEATEKRKKRGNTFLVETSGIRGKFY